MKNRKRSAAELPPNEIAHRMADAVTYLSRVAEDAGMTEISAELLAIRKRLANTADGSSSDFLRKTQGRSAAKTELRRIK